MEKTTGFLTQNETVTADDVTVSKSDDQLTYEDGLGTDDVQEMEPLNDDASEDMDADNFMKMYEESLKSIQEGEVVSGEIVQVDKEYVLVDIGYKSEGQISIHEFLDEQGRVCAKVGDKVEVLLEKREDDEGVIRLSKEKAAKIKIWDQIKEIYESDGTV